MKTDKARQKSLTEKNKNRTGTKILKASVVAISLVIILIVLRPGSSEFEKIRGHNPYNVILITIDTLRADRLGCYGCRISNSLPRLKFL